MVNIKERAIKLRQEGMTYTEIQKILGIKIPKSSLSYWCKGLVMSKDYKKKVVNQNLKILKVARISAVLAKKISKENLIKQITEKNSYLKNLLVNRDIGKIILSMLYVCEGSKKSHQSLTFGNSDSNIIKMFLHLLRFCYIIDERKFRCTLQCRADQDIKKLEVFWSGVTNIPLSQFYKVSIDKRTIGKPSKNPDYLGVCRIDYFSASLLLELKQVTKIICGMGS